MTISHPVELLLLSRLSPTVQERLQQIRALVLDVDGILTDGRLWYGDNGEVQKVFHALDGHGIRMLLQSGIELVVMTGRSGGITSRRCAELGIQHVFQGVRHKEQCLQSVSQQLNIPLQNMAFMGDDLIDLMAMQRCGLAISVPNAPIYIQQIAHYVTQAKGGRGAVRECIDLILAAQHKLAPFFQTNPVTGQ